MNEELRRQVAAQLMTAALAAATAQDILRRAESELGLPPYHFGGEIQKIGEVAGLANAQLAEFTK